MGDGDVRRTRPIRPLLRGEDMGACYSTARVQHKPPIAPSWEAGWAMGTYLVQDATYEEIYK
jgi:hypothetical protein